MDDKNQDKRNNTNDPSKRTDQTGGKKTERVEFGSEFGSDKTKSQ